MNIASRETYEGGSGGWADGRLGQAYDLVDSVIRELPAGHRGREILSPLMAKIEDGDIAIGKRHCNDCDFSTTDPDVTVCPHDRGSVG